MSWPQGLSIGTEPVLQGWVCCVCLDCVTSVCPEVMEQGTRCPFRECWGPGSSWTGAVLGHDLVSCRACSPVPQEGLLEQFSANPGAQPGCKCIIPRAASCHTLAHGGWGGKVVSSQGNGGQEWAAVPVRAVCHLQGHLRKGVLRSGRWTRWSFLGRDLHRCLSDPPLQIKGGSLLTSLPEESRDWSSCCSTLSVSLFWLSFSLTFLEPLWTGGLVPQSSQHHSAASWSSLLPHQALQEALHSFLHLRGCHSR